MLVIERALVGQTETPCAAIGQSYAEARLQRLDATLTAGGEEPSASARIHDGAKKFYVAAAVRQTRLPSFRWQEA